MWTETWSKQDYTVDRREAHRWMRDEKEKKDRKN